MNVQVHFGAIVPKIAQQPIGKLLTSDECKAFQRAADAVVILRVTGLLPNSEADRVLNRLGKRICKAANGKGE